MGNQRQAAQRGRSEVVRETPDGRPEQPFSEHMPGYSVEFDSTGKTPQYSTDFEALVDHLRAICASATQQGVSLKVDIFDTALQTHLFPCKGSQGHAGLMKFSTRGCTWRRGKRGAVEDLSHLPGMKQGNWLDVFSVTVRMAAR